jgi:DNA-binding IclR family transcriptional regulator
VRVARAYMESLAEQTLDTVHLSICDTGAALLLERIPGRRRVLPSLRIGERMKLSQCAIGQALLLDGPEDAWRETFAQDCGTAASSAAFVDSMRTFAHIGYAFDPGDTGERIATIAAPVRGAAGTISACIGLSTASQYLDGNRLATVGADVARAAAAISLDLGRPNAGFDAANASVPRIERHAMLDGGLSHRNGEIRSTEHAKPLEAGAQPVHDPAIKSSRRANSQKDGVT